MNFIFGTQSFQHGQATQVWFIFFNLNPPGTPRCHHHIFQAASLKQLVPKIGQMK
jgi:hypothetical protein